MILLTYCCQRKNFSFCFILKTSLLLLIATRSSASEPKTCDSKSQSKFKMSLLEEIRAAYHSPEKLKVRDPDRVEEFLRKFVEGGPESLQVITDFDHTLTKFKTPDGISCDTCHGIIDHSSLVPDEFKKKSRELREKYYPIEIDPDIKIENKIPSMIEWYKKSQAVLVEYKFSKSEIREMVRKSRAILRDKVTDTLSILYKFQVPVLIFSAGIGDLLEYVLERDHVYYPNLKVVSNYMEYDESHRIKAFKEPLIHMFNKNENALKYSSYFDKLRTRNNALLLGDSLGDVQMSHGMPSSDSNVLKIGFLNDKINERLEEFTQNFDIVVLDDQSFDLVQLILSLVLKTP